HEHLARGQGLEPARVAIVWTRRVLDGSHVYGNTRGAVDGVVDGRTVRIGIVGYESPAARPDGHPPRRRFIGAVVAVVLRHGSGASKTASIAVLSPDS